MTKERYFDKGNINLQSRKLILDCGVEENYLKRIYRPVSPALLVLDLQNFFLDSGSRAYTPSAEAIVRPINELIESFRKYNLPIIFTAHENHEQDAGMMAVRWKHLIPKNSFWSELQKELQLADDIVIHKNQYDAFHGTGLDEILIYNGIKSLVITGVLQNLCVESTLRSAFVRGYAPILPVDCTAAYNYDLHLSSLKCISSGFCSPCLSKDVIKLLNEEFD
jgi:nicotinamidase-related amidase